MSTPLGEKTLATMPDRSTTSQRTLTPAMRASSAANDIVPHAGPPLERLVQFRGVDAVQPDQLVEHDDRVAVDDLGGAGERFGTPAERQNGEETSEHAASVALPD
jgi:hypothetical protein